MRAAGGGSRRGGNIEGGKIINRQRRGALAQARLVSFQQRAAEHRALFFRSFVSSVLNKFFFFFLLQTHLGHVITHYTTGSYTYRLLYVLLKQMKCAKMSEMD